jgi:hypothetical protein
LKTLLGFILNYRKERKIRKMEIEDKKYGIEGSQLRNMVESYASLACSYVELSTEENFQERLIIAKRVLNKILPLYKKSIPEGLSPLPRQIVNVGALERTCSEIVSLEESKSGIGTGESPVVA